MIKAMAPKTAPRLVLQARTAAELMMPNPVSLHESATVREALGMLLDRRIHAAPVIDDAGHPKGVVSTTDILIHEREQVTNLPRAPEFYSRAELTLASGEELPRGFQVEKVDRTRVRDIMTPAVFAVPLDASAAQVVKEMLDLKVHRLFVLDGSGVLTGVISTLDVLRHLQES
jgi:CBS domain-containing protein